MRKGIFILAFALIIIMLYIIFDFYILKDAAFETKLKANANLECNLNVQDCIYNFKGKEVTISLEPKPLQALEVTHLKVKNLGSYENLKLKIYGLNMFMGEIKPKIIKINENDYESKLVLSVCTLDSMIFRAEFLNNDQPIGFYFDFELKR